MPEINEKEVADYWNANAPVWIDQVAKGRDVHREMVNNPAIFELIGEVKGKRVLDAGCGEGRNTRLLAEQGAIVCGVDLCRAFIDRARAEEERTKLGIEYILGSYSSMPFLPDARFDLVVSFMALMDGPDYAGALREFSRVLKTGGELVFNITHPGFLTPGLDWLKDDAGNKVKLTVSGYFNRDPFIDRWKFSQSPEADRMSLFAIPRFHRTLSEYLNGLVEAGFSLVRINEPQPAAELCEKYPWFRTEREIAPIFLHVKARKV